jgi:hypothetical protein
MGAVDFDIAPPTRVGGRLLVPIHIVDLRAEVTIDLARVKTLVDATMTYAVGPTGGYPLFDLRQRVQHCWIDGAAVCPALIAAQDVGEPHPHSSMRVIGRNHRAGSVHTIRVIYPLAIPQSDLGGAYPPVLTRFSGARIRWSFGMADLYAGRYLEAWFPSNLPFDHFPFTLHLAITGTPIPHTVITNGRVLTAGMNNWSIRFPSWFTTMSPLLEVHAADALDTASATMHLPISRRTITITACKFAGAGEDLAAAVCRIAELLSAQERRFGAYGGDSYVCFFHGAAGGMEYAHAATTSESALCHEVIHSWFARGVAPASQADGWWDEGFTRYLETDQPPQPFDFAARPVELCSRRPFQRTTSPRSYDAGSRVFRGIAAMVGPGRLIDAMTGLYSAHRRMSVSTAVLERHLVAATGQPSIRDAFHRFVYGLQGSASAEPRAGASARAGT